MIWGRVSIYKWTNEGSEKLSNSSSYQLTEGRWNGDLNQVHPILKATAGLLDQRVGRGASFSWGFQV